MIIVEIDSVEDEAIPCRIQSKEVDIRNFVAYAVSRGYKMTSKNLAIRSTKTIAGKTKYKQLYLASI